jgi:hypothetical protein
MRVDKSASVFLFPQPRAAKPKETKKAAWHSMPEPLFNAGAHTSNFQSRK